MHGWMLFAVIALVVISILLLALVGQVANLVDAITAQNKHYGVGVDVEQQKASAR